MRRRLKLLDEDGLLGFYGATLAVFRQLDLSAYGKKIAKILQKIGFEQYEEIDDYDLEVE